MQKPGSYKLVEAIFPVLPTSASNDNNLHAEVTQVFHVPLDECKFDRSDKFGKDELMRTWQTIMTETHAHIEMYSSKSESLTFVLNGKKNEVLEARRRILAKCETQTCKQIRIPKDHHRWILGKQRQRLNVLETNTATKIDFPDDDVQSDIVTITGTKKGIEKVVYRINVISDEQLRKAFERISVPKMYYPFICGPHNEYLNAIIAKTRARINIPPSSVQTNEITIAGNEEGVAAAKKTIENIYANMKKRCKTVLVEIPKWQHKYVIGPRKSTIAEILHETGVSVEVPTMESPTTTITLRGPQEKLGQALDKVYEKANSVCTTSVDAPARIHKYIIGHKGANIIKITGDLTKVVIEFTAKWNKIKIEGPREEVEKARKELDAVACDLIDNFTLVELQIDPKYLKYIIVNSDAIVNRLTDETCEVTNMFDEDGSKTICISSMSAGNTNDLIAEFPEAKSLGNNYRSYRSIISGKGDDNREVRDSLSNVQIKIPAPGMDDIVKIRGPKKDAEKYHTRLIECVEELYGNSRVLAFPISKQLHKFVITQTGNDAICKIRERTNTEISLPTMDEKNAVITITGNKKNAEKARDEIQMIELRNIVTEEISITPKIHNSLIGNGGKLLRSIMEDCGGVSIKFPRPESESSKVRIKGSEDDVRKAKQQLLELTTEKQVASANIKKASSTHIKKKHIILDEIRIDPKYHMFFMSDNGAFLEFLSFECGGAQISFPSPVTNSDRVLLKGYPEHIEIAKVMIGKFINDVGLYTEDEKKYGAASGCDILRRAQITAPRVQWGRKRKQPKNFIYY